MMWWEDFAVGRREARNQAGELVLTLEGWILLRRRETS